MLLFLHADEFQLVQKGLQGIHHMGADIATYQKQLQVIPTCRVPLFSHACTWKMPGISLMRCTAASTFF